MYPTFARVLIVAVLILLFSASASTAKEDSSRNWGFDAALYSAYMWRGINYSDGFVLQPDLWFGMGPFTFDIWANFELENEVDLAGEFSEVDFSLTFDQSVAVADLTFGVIYYTFPATDDAETIELFAGATLTAFPFDPSLTIYVDIDEADGAYFDLGFGGTVFGDPGLTGIDWRGHLGFATSGYNKFYFGDGTVSPGSSFNDISLEVSKTFALSGFTLTPTAGFSSIINDGLRDLVADEDNFWIGVIFGWHG